MRNVFDQKGLVQKFNFSMQYRPIRRSHHFMGTKCKQICTHFLCSITALRTRRCQWCVIICAPVFQSWSKGFTTIYQDQDLFFVIHLFLFHFAKYFPGLNAPWRRTTTSITGKFPATFSFTLSITCLWRWLLWIHTWKEKRCISLTIYQSMGALLSQLTSYQ